MEVKSMGKSTTNKQTLPLHFPKNTPLKGNVLFVYMRCGSSASLSKVIRSLAMYIKKEHTLASVS